MPDEVAAASAEDHRPERDRDSFDCPSCGRFAHQHWARLTYSGAEDYVEIWRLPGSGAKELWHVAKCQRCRKPSIWRGEEMVYPLARLGAQAHEDMPDEVRELYAEAASVAAVSRRAGAALARATVERLLKHELVDPDAPRRAKLDERIGRVRPRVSTSLGGLLDVVRFAGNKMLHVEDEPGEIVAIALDEETGPAMVELLLDAANDLVDELITRPRQTSALWERLPETVRAQIQRAQRQSDA